MTGERKDKDLRASPRRNLDARVGRSSRRAFRPLRWAWMLLLAALLAPTFDLFFPAGFQPSRERRTIVIERGTTLHEIARDLQRSGVIKSQVGFLVLARAMQLDRRVKAGQYSFRLGITVPALLRALDRGMYGLNLVTIPEGLMIRETARIIELQVGISAISLDSLSRDPATLDSLEIGAPSLEGWLAPDSYEWLPGTAPEVVLRTMVARTRERVQRATAGYDSLPLGMNQHEVLTLASIVEAESRANDERPRIARVYLNRLERGMLLQADPTVGYALGRGPRSRLLFKDLRVESPYNTYRHEGLPPGPICSPGESAIQAVMNATPSTNELYFVANGKGRHIFAPTYQQHLANIDLVKSRMRAEASARAAQVPARAASTPGATLTAADDEEVVGGEVGDSGAVKPSGKGTTPPGTPNTPAPSAPGVTAQGTGARATAPPIANLTRLSPAPSQAKPAPTPAATPPVTANKSAPAPSATAESSAPLKGKLLVPRELATVASSTPGSVAVVKKPVVLDTSKAKKPAAKAPTTSKPAAKPAADTTAATKPTSATSSRTTATVASKSGATVTTVRKSSTSKTSKPADSSASKAKAKPKPEAKSSGEKASKSKTSSTSKGATTKAPAAKKSGTTSPKPAAKDSTR